MALQTRDLGVAFGATPVLHGVDLTITAGEIVAVLGANGAGKSSLVKALVGLVPPTAGQVHLYGADVAGPGRAVPWHRIGYAPQRAGSMPGVPATVLEVVASGLLHRAALRPGRHARRKCLEALDQVRLGERAQESMHTLSGGQQQRVLIARALVREPDLLILDEPLSGMDRESMGALAATIATLRRRGATVVVVLHELGPLAGLITRTVVLHGGRVIHDTPTPAPGAPTTGVVETRPHPAVPLSIPTTPELQRQ